MPRERQAFLRAKMPDAIPNDLKTVPSIVDTLELSRFDDRGNDKGDDDIDGEDEHEEKDVQIEITNLDPPLGHIC